MSPQRMGLPVDRLVIATNVNDILARTLATGTYELREVVATIVAVDGHPGVVEFRAPAVRGLSAATPPRSAAPMASLAQSRRFSIVDAQALSAIRAHVLRRPRRRGRDRGHHPHHLARDLASGRSAHRGGARGRGKGNRAIRRLPMIVLGTAHPAKFPRSRRGGLRRAPGLAGLAFRSARAARSASPPCPSIRRRSRQFILAASRAAREGAAA